MDSSSYIGDVIMIERDTHDLSCHCQVDVDVDDRIATLESEIASQQAELTHLKSSSVSNNNNNESHMIVNNYKDTAAAIEDTADDIDQSNIDDEENVEAKEEDDIITIKNEASAVKETARLLLRKMAEQYQTNEQLRSDVEQIKNEMGRSLAKVTVENLERGKALEMKDKLYADLQRKYNDVVMALGEEANDDLRRVQMNGYEREEELKTKILKLELDLLSNSSCPCKEIVKRYYDWML